MFSRLQFLLLTLLLVSEFSTRHAAADDESTRDRRHRQLLEKRQSILDGLQVDLKSVSSWCAEHELAERTKKSQDWLSKFFHLMSMLQHRNTFRPGFEVVAD